MEDLIFIVLFVAIPVTLLTMGFIAVLTREKRELKEQNGTESAGAGRKM
jgi:hypothetical protein